MTEPYRIALASEARRGLDRLPGKIAVAIVEFVVGVLPADPYWVSKPLSGDLEGYRSARRGDYRVLIRIVEADHTFLVVRVAHRADVYRPR